MDAQSTGTLRLTRAAAAGEFLLCVAGDVLTALEAAAEVLAHPGSEQHMARGRGRLAARRPDNFSRLTPAPPARRSRWTSTAASS